MRYINIHSHRRTTGVNEITIQSLYSGFDDVNANGYFSLGLHPWHLSPGWQHEFELLTNKASLKNVVAIGECGLDKLTTTDLDRQKEVFVAHIDLALKLKKPLVIHCVKAYEEVLALLKHVNNKIPVIFHGFDKRRVLAGQLLDKGYYLSFGKALSKKNIREYFSALPIEKIFLETDDADVTIEQVYKWAAEVKNIPANSLSLQIEKNTEKVFGIKSTEM